MNKGNAGRSGWRVYFASWIVLGIWADGSATRLPEASASYAQGAPAESAKKKSSPPVQGKRPAERPGTAIGATLEDLFGFVKPGEELRFEREELELLLGDQLKQLGPEGQRLLGSLSELRVRFIDRERATLNLRLVTPLSFAMPAKGKPRNFQLLRIQVPKTVRLELQVRGDQVGIVGPASGPEALSLVLKAPFGRVAVRPSKAALDLKTRQADLEATAWNGRVQLLARAPLRSGATADLDLWTSLRKSLGAIRWPGFVFRQR